MKIKPIVVPLVILISFLFHSCSQNTDWLQFRGRNGNGISSSRINPPLGVRWKITLQETDFSEPRGFDSFLGKISSFNPPIVMDNTIFFGSGDGNFYALDAESGYMRWVFKSGASINSIPCADEHNVYFGSQDGKLYALSRETGEEVWHFQVNSQINSQVARHGNYVIFAGDADAIYFLSPDGKEQFRIDNPGWYNFTFNISNDVMYFGTGMTTDIVGPYDINQKEFLWYLPFYEFDANLYSVTAVHKNLLYFGTMDVYSGNSFSFHALDRRTGNIVWQQERDFIFNHYNDAEIGAVLFRNTELLDFLAPAIWKNSVIFTAGDCAARAFDSRSGILRWEKVFDTPVASAPTIAGDRVYFGLLGDDVNSSKLVCVSAQDGKLLWEMETEGALLSAPVIAGKRIIFGTDESVFYVLEEVF